MLITLLRTIAALLSQYLSCRHKYGHDIGDDEWEKSVSLLAGGAATFRMRLTNKCHLLSGRSVLAYDGTVLVGCLRPLIFMIETWRGLPSVFTFTSLS